MRNKEALIIIFYTRLIKRCVTKKAVSLSNYQIVCYMAIVHHRQTSSGNAEVVFKLETIGYDSLKEKRQNRLYLLSLPNSNYLNHDWSVFHL